MSATPTMRYIWFLILFPVGCETTIPEENAQEKVTDPLEVLIGKGEVTGGLNPFPLVENPQYLPAQEVAFFDDDEWVLLVKSGDRLLAYPQRSMHVEIVNQEVEDVLMAVSYCPITRSGLAWNRSIDHDTIVLTASGYLFRDNLMPLDLHSGSIWSQMTMEGISGPYRLSTIETIPLIEVPWKMVREYFPEAVVFISKQSFNSASPEKALNPLTAYKRELGILNRTGIREKDAVELFSPEMFQDEVTLLVTTVHHGGRVVVAGSALHSYMTAFLTGYRMQPVPGEFPVIMRDETGTTWNVFGEAVSGPRAGEKLQSPVFYTAADWAWRQLFDRVGYHAR